MQRLYGRKTVVGLLLHRSKLRPMLRNESRKQPNLHLFATFKMKQSTKPGFNVPFINGLLKEEDW